MWNGNIMRYATKDVRMVTVSYACVKKCVCVCDAELMNNMTYAREKKNVVPQRNKPIAFVHSNAYSTAAEQASLAVASIAWRLRLCSVSKEASHAGHEWRPRDETLDSATERERFDD